MNKTISDKPVLHGDDTDLILLVESAWQAIADNNYPERLFKFNNMPVRLIPDKNNVIIDVLDKYKLQLECAEAANWIVKKHEHFKPARPPLNVVQSMMAVEKIPLPELKSVVYAPVFDKDGNLIKTPGYDKTSGIYYHQGNLIIDDIPLNPTPQDIEESIQWISNIDQDMPYTCVADRANAWAILFVIPCREMMGNIPANNIDSPDAGTGKGKLAESLLIPFTGGDWEKFTPTNSEEEERKRYTAALRNGKPAWIFDNYNELKGAQLAALLTTGKWSDRTLSKNEIVTSAVRQQIVITSNNLVLTKEIGRRIIKTRLDAKVEFPSLRTGFKIENLEAWVYEHRAQIIRSVLILIQSWIASGRPKPTNIKPLGSYIDYCNVIGGILQHIGVSGFLGNVIEVFEKSDMESRNIREFVSSWWDHIKPLAPVERHLKAADLYSRIKAAELLELAGKTPEARKKSFSYYMNKLKDRIFTVTDDNNNCLSLQIVESGKQGRATTWELVNIEEVRQIENLF